MSSHWGRLPPVHASPPTRLTALNTGAHRHTAQHHSSRAIWNVPDGERTDLGHLVGVGPDIGGDAEQHLDVVAHLLGDLVQHGGAHTAQLRWGRLISVGQKIRDEEGGVF